MSPLPLPLALPVGLDVRLAPRLRRPLPSRTPAPRRARLLRRPDRHVRPILLAALHAPLRLGLLSPSHPPSLTSRRSTPPATPVLRECRNPPGLLLASRPRQFQKSAEGPDPAPAVALLDADALRAASPAVLGRLAAPACRRSELARPVDPRRLRSPVFPGWSSGCRYRLGRASWSSSRRPRVSTISWSRWSPTGTRTESRLWCTTSSPGSVNSS